jgi:hypothetical protein
VSGADVTAVIVGAVVLLLGLVVAVGRRTSRRRGGHGRPGSHRDHRPPGPPTEELAMQASRALVDTDDAVRTSEQELGFAAARFGEHEVAPFSAALGLARTELAAAFRLWQLLDDNIRVDDGTRRSYLTEISVRCAEANRMLDERSAEFDRLQDLTARAPELLAEVDAHVAQQTARVARSRQILGHLAAKYTAQAASGVAAYPDQAAERLEFAASCLAAARPELTADERGQAAILLQAAEAGADQATDLLNGVGHMEAELTQAASALPAALRELDAEMAEAAALLAGKPDDERATQVSRAQAIASGVRSQQTAGPFDALAALRDLQQADAALDHVLASSRAAGARQQRASAALDQAMLVARSSMTAAGDFITTRRGGVGVTARTRLAEAQRHFQQAIRSARNDPEAALTEAQHADALAQEARAMAGQDTLRFDSGQADPAGGGIITGLGGAILGGIVIGSTSGRAIGETFGFTGTGPGSFGGTGSRGRRIADSQSGAGGLAMAATQTDRCDQPFR